MKKIVLVPDSFKGTMPSMRICELLTRAIRANFPQCEVVSIPVADGGEGTVECFRISAGGSVVETQVSNPFLEKVRACYLILPDGKTAVIEVASAVGLPLVENRKDPLAATSYGVGELVAHAVGRGCTHMIIGLGGSATNDAGAGMAAALGAKFRDADGRESIPAGGTLGNIRGIDLSLSQKLLAGCRITAMCDVDNPLYGKNGAAYVFGPQKGADPKMVETLDEGLVRFALAVKESTGADISTLKGGGAAGGMGAGIAALLGGDLTSGIDAVLDNVGFSEKAADADLILTGEGKIDAQSLRGKVVTGVARRAEKLGVPVVAIVGDIDIEGDEIYRCGVTSVISINRRAVPFATARLTCEKDLEATADALMRLLKIGK